ncbi:hypothetical protein BC832DRAFT_11089 [Gaertneriomyces semiglobifer]|nr:hypothetical protein BC832DRAFT_11089 [Gaertneriomyces semiglobifer]
MIFEQLIPLLCPETPRDACSHTVAIGSLDYLSGNAESTGPSSRKGSQSTDEDLDTHLVDKTAEMNMQAQNVYQRRDIPTDDVYWTYDYEEDLEEYLKYCGEDSDDDDDFTEALEDHKSHDLLAKAEVHSSLKYLFMVVNKNADSKRRETVKSLLDAVRPARSKWANEERLGQERLYDALEVVLTDLKNNTQHAGPFLKPVDLNMYPSYTTVVAKPMDLGTMTEKLNKLEYNSKKEFADDLYLIWQNCMAFNSYPPDNQWRRHAQYMRRKTTDLLKKVPDITITIVKAEVHGEDENEDDDEGDEVNGDMNGHGTSVNGIDDVPELSEESVDSAEDDLADGLFREPSVLTVDESPAPAQILSRDVEHGSLQEQRWKETVGRIRWEMIQKRRENLKRPFAERSAILATGASLASTVDEEQEYARRNKRRRTHAETKQSLENDEGDYEEQYFPEWRRHPCVPRVEHPELVLGKRKVDIAELFDSPEDLVRLQPSLSDYPEVNLKRKKGLLHAQIDENIKELTKVKEVHAKIQNKAAGHSEEIPWKGSKKAYHPQTREEDRPPLVVNEQAANAVAKQTVAKLLMHSGFDTASDSALSTLTDTFMTHFMNLGKTMRLYLDKHSRGMSSEEILIHTLHENGIEEVGSLDSYIRHDVERYGDKLYDLRRRLQAGYRDFCRRTGGDATEEEDIDMDEAEDGLMSGNFMNDLDLIGLRELGIEGVTSVPWELWGKRSDKPVRARVKKNLAKIEREDESAQAPAPPPIAHQQLPPWRAVDPSCVIGVLKPFYMRKAATTGFEEDDALGQKTRAKAMVALAKAGRAKPSQGDRGAKKKKGKDNAELAAEREAKRLKKEEEKAQKAKEREEAKKARDAAKAQQQKEKAAGKKGKKSAGKTS